MADDKVVQLRRNVQKLREELHSRVDGGGPPYDGDMEARVAKLEAGMEFVQREISEIKETLRGHSGKFDGLRDRMDGDFRITWGAMIAGFLGIAGLMAKGFGWI